MLEPSTVETVRTALENKPNLWLAFAVAVTPIATSGLIGWVTIRFVMPAVREELAASRLHMSEALTKRGVEAADDIKAARELSRAQHDALVDKIEGKIDRVDERARISETLLRSIAAKIGVVALVLLLSFGIGFGGGAVVARLQRPVVVPSVQRGECSEVKCSEEEYCCAHEKCCQSSRRAVDAVEVAKKPLSSLSQERYATVASRPCDSPRRDLCLGGR